VKAVREEEVILGVGFVKQPKQVGFKPGVKEREREGSYG